MLRDINPSEGGMKQNTFDYMMGHKKLMIYEQMQANQSAAQRKDKRKWKARTDEVNKELEALKKQVEEKTKEQAELKEELKELHTSIPNYKELKKEVETQQAIAYERLQFEHATNFKRKLELNQKIKNLSKNLHSSQTTLPTTERPT